MPLQLSAPYSRPEKEDTTVLERGKSADEVKERDRKFARNTVHENQEGYAPGHMLWILRV